MTTEKSKQESKSEPRLSRLQENGVDGPVVLLVDDDEIAGHTLEMMVSTTGCRVIRVENGIDAISIVNSTSIDLVITDLYIPNMSGLEIIGHIRKISKQVPVFIVTGYVEGLIRESSQLLESLNISEVLLKPVHLKDITSKVMKYLAQPKPPLSPFL